MASRIAIPGRLLLISLIALFFLFFVWQDSIAKSSDEVWVLTVKDTINPMIAEYLRETIQTADSKGIACLIIELDTPGGVLESTRAIVQMEMNADIPIVVYVSPKGARAASAGVFITLAAHVAVMAPATNIGAAHPVSIGPSMPMQPGSKNINPLNPKEESQETPAAPDTHENETVMDQKIMNDTLAWARTIAEDRGRNLQWVEAAVTQSISSTEHEALEAGVIDLICKNRQELLEALEGRTVQLPSGSHTISVLSSTIVEKPMNLRQRLLSTIINPTIAVYLLIGGLIGLYIELTHPGFILPGVMGAICLIMALFAMHTLPINHAGLFLLLLSFAFFIAEVKIQSYGVLTLGGIVAFLLGSSMLIDSDLPGMQVSMIGILPLAIAVAGITIFLVSLVLKAHKNRPITGTSGMIGLKGTVKTAGESQIHVLVHGELWRAVSIDDQTLSAGNEIEIVENDGLTLKVRKLNR